MKAYLCNGDQGIENIAIWEAEHELWHDVVNIFCEIQCLSSFPQSPKWMGFRGQAPVRDPGLELPEAPRF